MTPFENFTAALHAKGFTLGLCWEHKREQSRIAYYFVRSETSKRPNVASIIIEHWPDGGYDSFLPPIVNSIEGDVALIAD